MRVVVDTDGFGVTAYMQHTCGHEMGYFFGAEKFAQLYQEKYESLPCLYCQPLKRIYDGMD